MLQSRFDLLFQIEIVQIQIMVCHGVYFKMRVAVSSLRALSSAHIGIVLGRIEVGRIVFQRVDA